jgi:hypothetical protein
MRPHEPRYPADVHPVQFLPVGEVGYRRAVTKELEAVAVKRELPADSAAGADPHLVGAVDPGVDALPWRGEPAQDGGLGSEVAELTRDGLNARQTTSRRDHACYYTT